MSSRYIYDDSNSISPTPGMFSGESNPIWLQFVPGKVNHVFTSQDTQGYPDDMSTNSILAYSHYGAITQNKFLSEEIYKPLFRGFVDVPSVGDQVLLTTIGNENYYMGPINTANSPNFNIDQMHTMNKIQSSFEITSHSSKDFYDSSGISKNFPLKSVN